MQRFGLVCEVSSPLFGLRLLHLLFLPVSAGAFLVVFVDIINLVVLYCEAYGGPTGHYFLLVV